MLCPVIWEQNPAVSPAQNHTSSASASATALLLFYMLSPVPSTLRISTVDQWSTISGYQISTCTQYRYMTNQTSCRFITTPMATTGIGKLPSEILEHIFEILLPNTVYEKFIKPYPWGQWNPVQELAYKLVFSHKLVIENTQTTRSHNPSRIFYPKKNSVLTIKGFDHAYSIVRKLIHFNLETGRGAFPSEIGMMFHFTENGSTLRLIDELDYFVKLLEVFSFDNYYRQSLPKICFQILYEITLTPALSSRSMKLMHMIEVIGKKTNKLLILNRLHPKTLANKMRLVLPSIIRNLDELYLWNYSIDDYSVRHYLSGYPSNLRVLDLSANLITSLEELKLPPTLEWFLIGANNLTSMKGPNFKELVNLQKLDASINAICELDELELPQGLKIFKVSYNSIQNIHPQLLPEGIEVVVFSKNSIYAFDDDFVLPSTILELYLNSNGLVSLPSNFFINCSNLKILDLSDNNIDDLDELGRLPSSLRELTLDNNEIDYSNYSNILTEDLQKLSMNSTGLVDISNISFGVKLEILNLSGNEISIFRDLIFGVRFANIDDNSEENYNHYSNLRRLDLSHNKLTSFNLPGDNVWLPEGLEYLDLSNNLFQGIASIRLPGNLTNLILKDVPLTEICNDLLAKLPKTLKELRLDHTRWSSDSQNDTIADEQTKDRSSLNVDFAILPQLETLSLDHNNIKLMKNYTYPSNLRYLSFEHNQISDLDFSKIPTNIEQLQLNENPIKLKEISCCRILYSSDDCPSGKVEIADIPYFPHIKYFGLCGDLTELMKLGLFYGKNYDIKKYSKQKI